MGKIKILSIDGGGIRGIIPAVVLQYIEAELKRKTKNENARIADYFDLVAGTSIGGMLACYYLTPNRSATSSGTRVKYSAEQALNLLKAEGFNIFNKSKKLPWLGFRKLFDANRYNPNYLERMLDKVFGGLPMSSLVKPCIVPTYNLKTKSSFFFNSVEEIDKNRDFFIKDVARSTSAAPTYFPPAFIKNLKSNTTMANIDGGVFANNPAMCSYAECISSKNKRFANTSAENILLLSIGTGGGNFKLPEIIPHKRWGILSWAKSIPEIMIDGGFDTVDYQINQIFKGHLSHNYKRVDFDSRINQDRGYSSDMADASDSNIEALVKAGEQVIEMANTASKNSSTLDDFIDRLISE